MNSGNVRVGAFWLAFGVLTSAVALDANGEYVAFLQKHSDMLPQTYHLPKGDELSYWGTNTDTFFYKSLNNVASAGKAPYWTCGDFNRDGVIDRAYILFGSGPGDVRLFVFVSDAKSDYRLFVLAEATKVMGVDTILWDDAGTHILRLFEFEGGFSEEFAWSEPVDGFVRIAQNGDMKDQTGDK